MQLRGRTPINAMARLIGALENMSHLRRTGANRDKRVRIGMRAAWRCVA
jgi:hypothetical protein